VATPDAAQVRALAHSVRGAGEALRGTRVEERAEGIAAAARLLLDPEGTPGAELRAALLASTGLTAPVIEHGLRTTLATFERDALLSLLASARSDHEHEPARAPLPLAAVVLAGNVFSAAARPMLLPLLCGVPLLAKASSAGDALPRALQRALAATDPRLGAASAVVTYAREQQALTEALLREAALVSAYGSDETMAALGARLPAGTRLLVHGHGLSALVIARAALAGDVPARELAERIALDIAAYDQRGCLSPHFALVESGGAVEARTFARLLAEALASLERTLPRGALPRDAAADELQWRAVAAAVGDLHKGPRYAVSYEADSPLRPSPGYRNLAVHDCADLDDAARRLAPFGRHLKALALAPSPTAHPHAPPLAALAPYTCEPGSMQTPPLTAHLDGLHPLEGLHATRTPG
jgi:acyl-CoA reductase-like NAD-dependent aldehyde dehydrogenase